MIESLVVSLVRRFRSLQGLPCLAVGVFWFYPSSTIAEESSDVPAPSSPPVEPVEEATTVPVQPHATTKPSSGLIEKSSTVIPVEPEDSARIDDLSKIEQWTAGALEGQAWAAYNLGVAHQTGIGAAQSNSEAFRWYSMAANRGLAQAQANLGYCYDNGIGTITNPAEAFRWYQKAALQGDSHAQLNYADKLLTGRGVLHDIKQAREWFQRAADAGLVDAFYGMGMSYYMDSVAGSSDPGVLEQMISWLSRAANQGHPQAQFALGKIFEDGSLLDQAARWYERAAAAKLPEAIYNLGRCYEQGRGVAQNYHQAVAQYRQAANADHRESQHALGRCFYEGRGVQESLTEAYMWWNLAAKGGLEQASDNMRVIAPMMSTKQIDEAQSKALSFNPKPLISEEEAALGRDYAKQIAVTERRLLGYGSGFIATADGFVVTSAHILQLRPDSQVEVVTEGGRFKAVLRALDALNDLAILKIQGKLQFDPLPLLDTRNTQLKESVLALGFDGSNKSTFSPRLFQGSIIDLKGTAADPTRFKITGPPLKSSFGGTSIINNRGQVIGVLVIPPEGAISGVGEINAMKAAHLRSWLKNKIPGINLPVGSSGPIIDPGLLTAEARGSAAMILIY